MDYDREGEKRKGKTSHPEHLASMNFRLSPFLVVPDIRTTIRILGSKREVWEEEADENQDTGEREREKSGGSGE